MGSFSRFNKLVVLGLGAVGGGLTYYTLNAGDNRSPQKFEVQNSWTTNYTPTTKWDYNWDHRDPKSIVKPSKKTPEDDNRYNKQIEEAKSTACRHIFLIRHGQYFLDGKTDKERTLTELGMLQADLTGKRLASLGHKYNLLVKSTMTRAQQTADIIARSLPKDIEVQDCSLLQEGAPIPPEPPIGHWRPEPQQFFQDGARIEAAYRKYFHRAPPSQTEDTYTILVCHANVIRYFVCKALQFPPEGWLRISLNHGSITWLSIQPSGRVVLRALGDTGHMPPENVTSRNVNRKTVGRNSEANEDKSNKVQL